MANGGFAKVVLRQAADIPTPSRNGALTAALERRATATTAAKAAKKVAHRSSSGLSPAVVIISVGVLLAVFLVLLLVGLICKIVNKPKKEAAPFVQQRLYQPSAAGYGTRVAMRKGQQGNSTPGKGYGSRVSLLDTAGPMGTGGRLGDDTSMDTSFDSPSLGSHGGDYFSRAPNKANGHTRGQSSGVQMPGATALASRKGGVGTHPSLGNGMLSVAPDGSGFKPGQTINAGGGYAGPPSPLKGPGGAPLPPHARVGLGRPPAADGKRRSRYSRATSRRIESMGPGALRKSIYLGADDDPMNPQLYPEGSSRPRVSRKPSTEANTEDSGLRRIDSMGKGDARRKSQIQSTSRASRAMSVYAAKGNEKAMFLSAQADGFGAGRGDPLGARHDGPNSLYLTPQVRSSSDSRSRSGSSTGGNSFDKLDRQQRLPNGDGPKSPLPSSPGYPSGGAGLGVQVANGKASSMNGGGNVQGGFRPGALVSPTSTQTPISFPGGGAPRIRNGTGSSAGTNRYAGTGSAYGRGAPMQAAGGGYDRGVRQVL